MRIVSLVPAATEIVAALGLAHRLVGVSHECDVPPQVGGLPRLTSSRVPPAASSAEIDRLVRERSRARQPLYALDAQGLEDLRPDVIITQGLCHVCAVDEEEVRLAACRLPAAPILLDLEPRTLEDVLASVALVARALGVEEAGRERVGALVARIEAVTERSAQGPVRRMVFLEWPDPPFSSGHWNPGLVRRAGGLDPLGRHGLPAATLDWDAVAGARPELIFVACCGYDAARTVDELERLESVSGWRELDAVRAGRVRVSDGNRYFSRPGPGLVDSLEILAHALDPERHPLPVGLPAALPLEREVHGTGREVR